MTRQKEKRRLSAAVKDGRLSAPQLPEAIRNSLYGCQSQITSLLQNVDIEKIRVEDANSLYKVATALSAISRSIVEIERWTTERDGLIQIAYEKLCDAMRKEMVDEPELLEQVLAFVDGRVIPKLEA